MMSTTPNPGKQPSKPPGSPIAAPKPPTTAERRGFMTVTLALITGAFVGLVPLASGLFVFLDPLRRKGNGGAMIPVAPLDALPADGIPRRFPVIAERVDAWNRSIEPVGAVYLRRVPGEETLECLTATCPHAGCLVDFDTASNTFKCPCHNSNFSVTGAIIEPSPSPRAMDSLEYKVDQQEVLVKFESFYSGRTEKVAKA